MGAVGKLCSAHGRARTGNELIWNFVGSSMGKAKLAHGTPAELAHGTLTKLAHGTSAKLAHGTHSFTAQHDVLV